MKPDHDKRVDILEVPAGNNEEQVKDSELVMLGIKQPTDNIHRKKCMIYPNDTCKLWWDVSISLVLLISTFTTPIDLAFSRMSEENPGFSTFNYTLDFFFLLDIIVMFNSAIQDEYFNIIDDRKDIAIDYMKCWFFIDIIAIIPLDLLITTNDLNSLIRITRAGKLYKLIKVTRLVRLLKVIKQKGKLINTLNNIFNLGRGFEKLSFIALIFLMICHLMACIWIFIADLMGDEAIDA